MKCLVLVATYLVLQTAFTGVTAAAGDFKEACNGATPPACTNTATDTCDTTKCVRKIGQACTAGNADECVSTAVTPCPVGNKCECDATTKGANTDKTTCLTLIGQQCTAPAECLAAGATCTGTPKVCGCPAGKTPKPDNTECLKRIDELCTAGSECVSPATCPAAPKNSCTCPDKQGANADKTKCVPKVGEDCTTDCVPGTTCTGSPKTCACDDAARKVASIDNSFCKLKVNESCTTTDDCGENTTCPASGTKVCTCATGSKADNEGRCVKETGGGDSGAAGLIASVALLLAVYVTSRLLY